MHSKDKMQPSDEIIEQFQKIYFEEFGQEISQKEAYEKFLRLVNLLRVITRPSDHSNLDRNNKDATLNHYP
ncbi:MAG: hypothetical protein ABIF11_00330 [Nitrospirota bacterium]